jgi:hypothetical protein
MNTVIRKTKWTSVGLLLALTCAAPVYADDTELLLLNPNAASDAVPNVLLIIDSSGSMGNTEQTREVYNSAIAYPGSVNTCDPAYLRSRVSVFTKGAWRNIAMAALASSASSWVLTVFVGKT